MFWRLKAQRGDRHGGLRGKGTRCAPGEPTTSSDAARPTNTSHEQVRFGSAGEETNARAFSFPGRTAHQYQAFIDSRATQMICYLGGGDMARKMALTLVRPSGGTWRTRRKCRNGRRDRRMNEHVAGRDAEVVRVRRRQGLEVTANLVDELKADMCARAVCGVGVRK